MSDRWPALLSKETAAEYLDISIPTLEREMADGKLRPVMVRGKKLIRFRRTELDEYIEDLPRDDAPARSARQVGASSK